MAWLMAVFSAAAFPPCGTRTKRTLRCCVRLYNAVGRVGRSVGDNNHIQQIRRVVETQKVIELLGDEFLPVVDRQHHGNSRAEAQVFANGRTEAIPVGQQQGIAQKDVKTDSCSDDQG